MPANYLALDIGGANIKAANGSDYAESYPFQLWREPHALAQQIRSIISDSPTCDHLVVTMTGELADCFATKAEGVKFILKAVAIGSDNRHTRVYRVDGKQVTPVVAANAPLLVAAANWHALASFAARFAGQSPALLIDVGSTTTDVIPLIGGKPAAFGKTDTERLLAGELVYTGVERSPVCAVLQSTSFRGKPCQIVQEFFATMRDAYLIQEKLPEDPSSNDTADRRPATKPHARLRLARMIAADQEEFNHRDAVALATEAAAAQAKLLRSNIERVVLQMAEKPTKLILSGHGEFLIAAALEGTSLESLPSVSLTKEIGPLNSRCAPAYALAVLARESAAQ
ncbi:hydantoinase/oxoprolinase family protein [Anatilimnocola floriformis]|uniref:hydantoinase/oxoprolinase family protein n=1 Tax=Anatilimnocola floriformis TaxID=2948575 RepID=UPI0020C2E9A2|nr:hydantoinase/oxoprolinase family protein [Anatilimnocola floriformis]